MKEPQRIFQKLTRGQWRTMPSFLHIYGTFYNEVSMQLMMVIRRVIELGQKS